MPYWSRETSARDRSAREIDMRQRTFSATVTGFGPWLLGAAVAFSAACGGADTTWETRVMSNDEAAATLGTAEQVRIDQPTVTARLPIARSGPAAEPLRQALAGQRTAELALDGITVEQPPGVLFNVYLSTTGPNPRRQYVGTLSFFGVTRRSGHGSLPGRTFDVTEQLQALKGQSPQLPDLQVVFEATNGTAGSTPEKAGPLNRQAGLRVGSIRLRVEGKP